MEEITIEELEELKRLSKEQMNSGKVGLSDDELDSMAGGSLYLCTHTRKKFNGKKLCVYATVGGEFDYNKQCNCEFARYLPK